MSDKVQEGGNFMKMLEIASKPDAIRRVEKFIDEIRDVLSFKDDVYGNVMVAITEAVNNSIFHGNAMDENKKVHIRCESVNSFRLSVEVRDEGTGFNPEGLGDPTSPDNIEKPGGRGVFLMKNLSDEIVFSDDGRCVQMIFNI